MSVMVFEFAELRPMAIKLPGRPLARGAVMITYGERSEMEV